MIDTKALLFPADFPRIARDQLHTLQVNLGYLCNLSCVHCHVNAGPTRTELMSAETVEIIKRVLTDKSIQTLDLTGGAPELNPHFRDLVKYARSLGVEVIDRCNLTILFEQGQEDLADFLAEHGVNVTASLPCYLEENVSKQRGKGVYQQSIDALRRLNALGYGLDPKLPLNLVFNPVGPNLPPAQEGLQADYKARLQQDHGVVFNELYTITNVPINRFGSVLHSHNEFHDYVQLLKDNFSHDNLATVMCRGLISIDWEGFVYDCDFNQMLDMPLASEQSQTKIASDRGKLHIADLLSDDLSGNPIQVANHCYACTAGQGSSCGGALSA